jgi:hypothetical protein
MAAALVTVICKPLLPIMRLPSPNWGIKMKSLATATIVAAFALLSSGRALAQRDKRYRSRRGGISVSHHF